MLISGCKIVDFHGNVFVFLVGVKVCAALKTIYAFSPRIALQNSFAIIWKATGKFTLVITVSRRQKIYLCVELRELLTGGRLREMSFRFQTVFLPYNETMLNIHTTLYYLNFWTNFHTGHITINIDISFFGLLCMSPVMFGSAHFSGRKSCSSSGMWHSRHSSHLFSHQRV